MGGVPDVRPRILIAVPPGAPARSGNRVSASRWARLLRELGYRTRVQEGWPAGPADCLLALHARRNAPAVRAFRSAHPDRPLVVVLTGTDVYRDLRTHSAARRALALADRLIVLQPEALEALPGAVRARAQVIYQSARPLQPPPAPRRGRFDVACVGHLRAVKDPMRAALASRALPVESRIQVIQAGAAMTPALAARAERETQANPRYRWVGSLRPAEARRLIARSRLLVVSSRMEGGANVIVAAVVDGVPVAASHVSGNIGMLGRDYPGYFEVGDTGALTALLRRCECEPGFLRRLQSHCAARRHHFTESTERESLGALMEPLLGRPCNEPRG